MRLGAPLSMKMQEAAGVCGGRGALWDLNGGLGRNRSMVRHRKSRSRPCAVVQRAAGGLVEGGEGGRGLRVSAGMYRRAGAHPRVVGNEGIRKNRSTCMLIVPQQ